MLETVKFFLSISFNICFGCSKEPSHQDGSFEYPQHISMPTHISVWGYMYPLVFPFGGTCSFLRVHIF